MLPPSMPRLPLCLLLAVLCAAPCAAQPLLDTPTAEPPSRTRFLRWAYQDAYALARQADARTPLYALGAAAVLAPLSTLDPNIDRPVLERRGAFGQYLDLTNELGGPKMNLPVVGIFAASLLTDDARFQDAAFTSLQSMVYAGVFSYGLKYSFGRVRPEDHPGQYRFAPFSGATSFPSGHTTTAFATLTPWVLYYPHPVTYTLYGAAVGGTAVSRIARDKHWATDVLAGGTLGFMTAYYLSRRHQDEAGRRLSVTPVVSYDAVSLSLRVRF